MIFTNRIVYGSRAFIPIRCFWTLPGKESPTRKSIDAYLLPETSNAPVFGYLLFGTTSHYRQHASPPPGTPGRWPPARRVYLGRNIVRTGPRNNVGRETLYPLRTVVVVVVFFIRVGAYGYGPVRRTIRWRRRPSLRRRRRLRRAASWSHTGPRFSSQNGNIKGVI